MMRDTSTRLLGPLRRRLVALALAGRCAARRRHGLPNIVGTGKGQILLGIFRRQDLDHGFVFDPDFDHMERAAIAVDALPPRALSDCLNPVGIGCHAEREMRGSITTRVLPYELAADFATGLKLCPAG